VKLVDYRFFPRPSFPTQVTPFERFGVYYFTRTMHIVWLESRSRVGHLLTAIDLELVSASRASTISAQLEPTRLGF